MKKNWQTILLAVMCVMLGICMAQIADLKEQLHSFENNTYNRLSYVEMNVNRLYSGIDETLTLGGGNAVCDDAKLIFAVK